MAIRSIEGRKVIRASLVSLRLKTTLKSMAVAFSPTDMEGDESMMKYSVNSRPELPVEISAAPFFSRRYLLSASLVERMM